MPAIARFATSFITLLQFHKQRNNLRKMITSQEWLDSKWLDDPKGKKVACIILDEMFWRNILYTLKLTSPLVSVLRMVDGERKPAMGYIYAAMANAKSTIEKAFNLKNELYVKTFDIIDKRWECQLHKPLHAAGHYLNPSIFYENKIEIMENVEVIDGLLECIERLSHGGEEEQKKITSELTRYQNAEGLFGNKMRSGGRYLELRLLIYDDLLYEFLASLVALQVVKEIGAFSNTSTPRKEIDWHKKN
ncbi:uncharacterized protein LOC110885413 [Helianthus annuus]|uniref:uncharacterized protein LOC110885413 n=1 Tax=Helianthus annuus TaxID=4232 RepID=UPI000B8FA327|nr:uncharacterized protein LOC110885413 [Helianthus annuus]